MKRLAALLLASLLAAGCRVAFREVSKPACQINKECPGSEVCFRNVCKRAEGGADDTLFAEITPPESFATPPQQQKLTPKAGRVALTWQATTPWFVFANTATGKIHVERKNPLIAKRPPTIEKPNDNDQFRFGLEPGTYFVTFFQTVLAGYEPDPTKITQFPYGLATWEVTKTAPPSISIDLAAPPPGAVLSGRLLYSPASPAQSPLHVAGARVIATDPESILSSTEALTSAQGGYFSLNISRDVQKIDLHVGPSPANPYVPTVTFSAIPLSGAAIDLGVLYLSNDVGIGNPQTVEGLVLQNGAPVEDVRVSAAAQIGNGVFKTDTVTDKTGFFSLAVLRGTGPEAVRYTVTALPPPGAEAARGEQTYFLPPTGEAPPLRFSLPPRARWRGLVTAADGSPLADARITITPADQTPPRLPSFSFDTASDGKLETLLDPGVYLVDLEPPAQTRTGLHGVRRTQITIIDQDLEKSISASPGFIIAGELDQGGRPFSGARIDFYRPEAADAAPRLVARALTDAQGHYEVVLPAD